MPPSFKINSSNSKNSGNSIHKMVGDGNTTSRNRASITGKSSESIIIKAVNDPLVMDHNDEKKNKLGLDRNFMMKKGDNTFLSNSASKALGPIAIVGGTVSIYTAALTHSSTTLTPLSVFYLVLLALNYSVMPRISKKYVSPKTNKESVALVEEVVKMSMGIGGFILTECAMGVTSISSPTTTTTAASSLQSCVNILQNSLSNWSIESTLLAAGLPSALYAIQGVLTYTSYSHLDSVTFNGLTQIKTLSAALCCYLVMGKVQSKVQILALGLLSLSTMVFQGTLDLILKRSSNGGDSSEKSSTSNNTKSGNTLQKQENTTIIDGRKQLILGIVPCLAATFLSGLAGAFSQRSLQTVVGSMERNAYFYSAEISFISALCLLFSMMSKKIFDASSKNIKSTRSESTKDVDTVNTNSGGYFDHWTWKTFIPIIVKASGGILTALVHKHSGSVMKGFSLVLGLVFSALLQTALDGKDLTMGQLIGTALVLLSSWLHFTNPATLALS